MAESVAPPPIPSSSQNTASHAAASGGHAFRSSFGSGSDSAQTVSDPTNPKRRKRRGAVLIASGVIAAALTCVGIQLGANLGYDEAHTAFNATKADAELQQSLLADELGALTETTDVATQITAATTTSLMDPSLSQELSDALAGAEDTTAVASALSDKQLPASKEKPEWAWELFEDTAQLASDRESTARLIDDFDSARDQASSTSATIAEAGLSAVLSAAEASETFEAAHISARNLDILALRNAASQLLDAATLDTVAASAYADLEAAAAQMLASEKTELAEKSGPLQTARVEIEAFARSIAPGVLLDFDWSERVNGYGYGDSMGGYATWWYADPGYATIELSNSVAANWPSDRSKALVAHEVGHAISVKCSDMYDDSTQENIEAWATAWAISMGYHNDANGTWAYGAPPQSLIDTAAKCR